MIKITNMDFSYKRAVKIFSALDLELKEGHIYGLLGKNGSGKSTLLKLISGMVEPSQGDIEVMKKSPFKRQPSLLEEIYYLPEEIDTPSETMRVYARQIGAFYPRFDQQELEAYMKEFDLELDIKLTKLSLGQKKKAAIAFALACNTTLLLMDEPTNGLDIPSKSQFRRVIARVVTEERAVIISTHQVRDLESLIDSIVILDKGQVVLNASTEEISEKLQFKTLSSEDTPLYEESTVAACRGVVENREHTESKIDIELLFNAATCEEEKISEIFKNH